ncbi:GNAT family N-acetyltransferase [Kordiimonas sp. SCSIO 12603]|uniref:GNAT family N-acetyltransferase n=1 Tax=Kordiimonas sp. SCSIO 12603 TaxID=2829596 RepID=UPI002103AD9D|nr:GNAT family N-acetyltransferase [Kordiimonas sp. SCSIO 12603]UTW57352.1 GNAT family N-acetyltransferase [Kordiimonas sp. SCSIO 12603]
MQYKHPELSYYISTDYSEFDTSKMIKWLSEDAYWSTGVPFEVMDRGFSNSLAFGVFEASGNLVGIARMITDRATFAYLADVYMDPDHRGKGLGEWLMEIIMAHPNLQELRRMMLATSDAHGLYEKFGFSKISKTDERLMEIVRPDIYKND